MASLLVRRSLCIFTVKNIGYGIGYFRYYGGDIHAFAFLDFNTGVLEIEFSCEVEQSIE